VRPRMALVGLSYERIGQRVGLSKNTSGDVLRVPCLRLTLDAEGPLGAPPPMAAHARAWSAGGRGYGLGLARRVKKNPARC
jgi:hypothetical protein